MILEKNIFVEKILPNSIIRHLSKKEMDIYRRPFKKVGEDRRATLSWPEKSLLKGIHPGSIVSSNAIHTGLKTPYFLNYLSTQNLVLS